MPMHARNFADTELTHPIMRACGMGSLLVFVTVYPTPRGPPELGKNRVRYSHSRKQSSRSGSPLRCRMKSLRSVLTSVLLSVSVRGPCMQLPVIQSSVKAPASSA